MRRLAVDVTPLRASRDLRLLLAGECLTGLGTQAALVALPFQLFTQTGSAFLTGLLGAVELVPIIGAALYGGAIADRMDRRRLLLLVQIGLVACAGSLAAGALAGEPPVWLLYLLGALLAGFGSVEGVTRTALVPNLVAPEHLRGALALSFGLFTLMAVVGPAAGGLLIAVAGVEGAYLFDAASCLAMVAAAYAMNPQPPIGGSDPDLGIGRAIGEGLRFVRRNNALKGSFAIDLLAMTFGMPRALFPVLALTVYDAGAAGTGVLYAAVSAGATVAALTTGWLSHARRLGRIVIYAVVVWGLAIAAAGLMTSLWPAAAMLAVAGAADSVSAVCRSTINQTITPDALRGRMSSVFMLVVTSGPRLGDVESGVVASASSARFAVVSGGLACLAGVLVVLVAFPALLAYDAERTGEHTVDPVS
ncbi:MAG TPA: MFS transporter [Solirubrobacteraceae bacterium]|nr:MFS transporter [Solirubrobacteraceae bacterium]